MTSTGFAQVLTVIAMIVIRLGMTVILANLRYSCICPTQRDAIIEIG